MVVMRGEDESGRTSAAVFFYRLRARLPYAELPLLVDTRRVTLHPWR